MRAARTRGEQLLEPFRVAGDVGEPSDAGEQVDGVAGLPFA
jgi:hypothetical protein